MATEKLKLWTVLVAGFAGGYVVAGLRVPQAPAELQETALDAPAVASGSTAPMPPTAEPVALRLLGTLVEANDRQSRAWIATPDGAVLSYRPGDSLPGGQRLGRIAGHEVILEQAGRQIHLPVTTRAASCPEICATPTLPDEKKSARPWLPGQKQENDGSQRLSRPTSERSLPGTVLKDGEPLGSPTDTDDPLPQE